MIRARRPLPTEDDGLQTDVMRFMAIIAFCLIAILALVRQVEPDAMSETRQGATVDESEPPVFEPEPEPMLLPQPASAPSPMIAQVDAPKVSISEQDTAAVTTPEPSPEPKPPPSPEPSNPKPEAAADADEGLVLRFASDSDFLRLVNSGRLEVFAFGDAGVLQLIPGLTFQSASAPGTVYELLPETLPDLILSALASHSDGAAHDRWGMRMPPRMEAQIREHLRHATRGALIIDRHGDVRHAADG